MQDEVAVQPQVGRPRAGQQQSVVGTGAYGLAPVVVPDARQALVRVLGDAAEEVWAALAARAGVTGSETDPHAVDRVIHTMQSSAEPVVVLCGRSLQIRVSSHRHLTATQRLVHGV